MAVTWCSPLIAGTLMNFTEITLIGLASAASGRSAEIKSRSRRKPPLKSFLGVAGRCAHDPVVGSDRAWVSFGLGDQTQSVLVADLQLRVRERIVAHDDRPAVLVGEIRTRAVEEVAVEEQDRAGFHLAVYPLEQRLERVY